MNGPDNFRKTLPIQPRWGFCVIAFLGLLLAMGPGWSSIILVEDTSPSRMFPERTASRLDKMLQFSEGVLTAYELIEHIGTECALETRVHGELVGRVSVRQTPVTARMLLNETLPNLGYAYLIRNDRLEIMTLQTLRGYFDRNAVTYAFNTPLSEPILDLLRTTPDLISTMGHLEIYPSQGLVVVRDLPDFVSRLEQLLEIAPLMRESVTI